MLPKALRWTVEEYMTFPDDGKRHEIIEGVHDTSPSPVVRHQIISKRLQFALVAFVERKKWGEILDAPMDVVLSKFSVVQPDILYISKSNKAIITEKNIQGAPDLIIEIVSPESLKRDKVMKKRLYAQSGVLEYWVVDPILDQIEVYIQGKKGYILSQVFENKGRLTTSLLPGLEIDVKKILAE